MSSSPTVLSDSTVLPAAAFAPAQGLTLLQSGLRPFEVMRALLTPDLDDQLHAASSLVALTNQRLLTWRESEDGSVNAKVDSVELQPGQSLLLHDHAGVATLELVVGTERLAVGRFTLGANLWAQKLVVQFGLALHELSLPAASRTLADMPGPLPEDDDDKDDVTSFAAEVEQPPSTWTLLRLWRFGPAFLG